MSGLRFTLISVGHGGGDGWTVGFRSHWALESRVILCSVITRGCDKTTQSMSSFHLIVGDIEEYSEESFVHERHAVIG